MALEMRLDGDLVEVNDAVLAWPGLELAGETTRELVSRSVETRATQVLNGEEWTGSVDTERLGQ